MSAARSPQRLRLRALALIGERYREPLTLGQLAGDLGCSPRALQRALAGAHTSFSEELTRTRLHVAAELLAGQSLSIEVVARLSGFSGAASLAPAFVRRYGMLPGRYRAAHR